MRAVLQRDDIFTIRVLSKEYVDEMYGEDYFDEYSLEIPLEIYEKALKLQQELKKMQEDLKPIFYGDKQ
jgi:hypothetical protein